MASFRRLHNPLAGLVVAGLVTLCLPVANAQANPEPYVQAPYRVEKLVKKPVVTSLAWQAQPVIGGEVFTQYVFVMRNPNSHALAEFPTVRLVARDAAGRIIASESQTMMMLPPSHSLAFSGQLATGSVIHSLTAQFIKANWIVSKPSPSKYRPLTTVNLAFVPQGLTGLSVSGEISNPYAQTLAEASVTAVFKDAAGNVVGGGQAYVDVVAGHGLTPFIVDSNSTWSNALPASVEVYVSPWSPSWDQWARMARQ